MRAQISHPYKTAIQIIRSFSQCDAEAEEYNISIRPSVSCVCMYVCSHWLPDLWKQVNWTCLSFHKAHAVCVCVRNGFMHVCAFPRQWWGLPLHMQAAIYFPFFALCSVSQIATDGSLAQENTDTSSSVLINVLYKPWVLWIRDFARHIFTLMMSVYWSENINTSII